MLPADGGAGNTNDTFLWEGMGFPLLELFSNLACRHSFDSLIYILFSLPAHLGQFAYNTLIAKTVRVFKLLKALIYKFPPEFKKFLSKGIRKCLVKLKKFQSLFGQFCFWTMCQKFGRPFQKKNSQPKILHVQTMNWCCGLTSLAVAGSHNIIAVNTALESTLQCDYM